MAGAVVLWAGMRGVAVSDAFRQLLRGKALEAPDIDGEAGAALGQVAASGTGAAAGTGSTISDAGMRYVGGETRYMFGRANPANGWDCSGFTSWVLNHDCGIPIPGYSRPYSFEGTSHGPVSGQYFAWTGAQRISRADIQAGDLCCWLGHVGIAISNTQLVHCPGPNGRINPVVGHIDGAARGPMLARRIISRGD